MMVTIDTTWLVIFVGRKLGTFCEWVGQFQNILPIIVNMGSHLHEY